MKILVVDDIIENRLALYHFLKHYGTCDLAENGIIAFSQFKTAQEISEPYDLVFMDLMMPEMDGVECTTHIRKYEEEKGLTLTDRSKVVMITAVDEKVQVDKAFAAGCDEYMVKPILKVKLTGLLEKHFPEIEIK